MGTIRLQNSMNTQPVTVARHAMATRFEIALYGEDRVALQAAADEALEEIQRIDTLLSWRNPTSPIALINSRAGHEPIRVNPELFNLLVRCRELWTKGNHAFDITVGPLMRAWGFHSEEGKPADPEELAAAQTACGMQYVELSEKDWTVRFHRPGMRLDFGAVGKGYALELAAEILRDAGVSIALLHGGTSTVCALGQPPGESGWKIAVEYPPGESLEQPLPILTVIELRNASMSVSAVWGRIFRVGEDTFGHVIDPRTGRPANRALLSIFVTENPTESDALSTALLTDGRPGVEFFKRTLPEARTLVLAAGSDMGTLEIATHGIDSRPRAAAKTSIVRNHESP